MHVTLSGASSYYCSDPVAISAWLVEQGYMSSDPRSPVEYIRLTKARSLLVIYHNGTILMQGADTSTPRTLFSTLIAQSALPF